MARPLGGVIFGHYADRVGRRIVLVSTLLLMGVASVLIGLLPGYVSIGIIAPIALVVLGDLIVADGVTEAALREKITAITVFGDVIAPAELIGMVQVLATEVFGDIKPSGEVKAGGAGPDGSGS